MIKKTSHCVSIHAVFRVCYRFFQNKEWTAEDTARPYIGLDILHSNWYFINIPVNP